MSMEKCSAGVHITHHTSPKKLQNSIILDIFDPSNFHCGISTQICVGTEWFSTTEFAKRFNHERLLEEA